MGFYCDFMVSTPNWDIQPQIGAVNEIWKIMNLDVVIIIIAYFPTPNWDISSQIGAVDDTQNIGNFEVVIHVAYFSTPNWDIQPQIGAVNEIWKIMNMDVVRKTYLEYWGQKCLE